MMGFETSSYITKLYEQHFSNINQFFLKGLRVNDLLKRSNPGQRWDPLLSYYQYFLLSTGLWRNPFNTDIFVVATHCKTYNLKKGPIVRIA
jgi:hypothetical protein